MRRNFVLLAVLVMLTRADGSPVYLNPAMIVAASSAVGVQCTPAAPTYVVTLSGSNCVRETLDDAVAKIQGAK